jgi:outer membrane protein assembly factor BamA
VHATGQILLDTRDEPGNPHKGLMVGVDLSRYQDLDGGSFNFNRFAFDARGFLPLGSTQRVVALRTLLYFDDPDEGSEIPFYMMESLGGSHTLRGFNSFRFRDEKVVLFQAEYRWEAAPPVEIAVFGDAGTVAPSLDDLDFSALKTDYGIGLRIKNFRATIFRLDYARGDEGGILLLRLSSSF